MNINEIFEIIQDNIDYDEIKGELTLTSNSIVWSYDMSNDEIDDDFDFDEDDDFLSVFESSSCEEKLMEIYHADIEIIERIIDDFGDDIWEYTEPKILKTSISFKIL